MSGRQRPPAQRDYEVSHFDHGHDHGPSTLADVSALYQEAPSGTPSGGGTTATGAAAADPGSNLSMLEALQAERDLASGTPGECVDVDPELLSQIQGNLSTGFTDWAVTDADATASLAVLEGASLEQRSALIESLRSSGELETLIENIPDSAYENMSPELAALIASDRVAEQLEGWWVTDSDAGAAMDLITAMPVEQQVAAMGELSDADFATMLEEMPADRVVDLQGAFEQTLDPERKLQLWEAVHAGRAQNTHDANMEENPWWFDWSDEAELVRHRNSQRDATLASTNAEIADEAAVLRERMANGEAVTAAEIDALHRRKLLEHDLEVTHGVNITNDFGQAASDDRPETQRRVWSEAELHILDGAFQRMPEGHVRNNPAFTEVRRMDVARRKDDAGVWQERTSVGASAGSGLISFYDTGAGSRAGDDGKPWRTGEESELSGHDAAEHGAAGATHLIQEVLSHELGHTVHQGDSQLESDFHDLSDWQRYNAEDAKRDLMGRGLTEAQADTLLANLDATRSNGYNSRNQEYADGDLFMVNPYDDEGYVSLDAQAVDPNDSDWAYAESNASDHFAEIYTKAIHAPESLYDDLITGPEAALAQSLQDLEHERSTYESAVAAGLLSDEDLELMRLQVEAAEEVAADAQDAADIRRSQHEFFQDRVFGVDDSDIQALVAPAGKEAIYEEYQQQAAMCMTPQQLAALRIRYQDRL